MLTNRTVTSSLFWDFTQRGMVISYRRFETTYRSHFQRPSPRAGADRLPRNVGNCHSIVRETPGEGRSHLQGGESMKSRKTMFLVLTSHHMQTDLTVSSTGSQTSSVHGALSVSANLLRRPYAKRKYLTLPFIKWLGQNNNCL